MIEQSSSLTLGADDGGRVIMRFLGRSCPDATDFWEGNWVKVAMRVEAGVFSGEYVADLRTCDFAHFHTDLSRLYNELRGEAFFEPLEPWLTARITTDGRGHFTAHCTARDCSNHDDELRFTIWFDQTQMPHLIADLDRVMNAFPVVGQRTNDP